MGGLLRPGADPWSGRACQWWRPPGSHGRPSPRRLAACNSTAARPQALTIGDGPPPHWPPAVVALGTMCPPPHRPHANLPGWVANDAGSSSPMSARDMLGVNLAAAWSTLTFGPQDTLSFLGRAHLLSHVASSHDSYLSFAGSHAAPSPRCALHANPASDRLSLTAVLVPQSWVRASREHWWRLLSWTHRPLAHHTMQAPPLLTL